MAAIAAFFTGMFPALTVSTMSSVWSLYTVIPTVVVIAAAVAGTVFGVMMVFGVTTVFGVVMVSGVCGVGTFN